MDGESIESMELPQKKEEIMDLLDANKVGTDSQEIALQVLTDPAELGRNYTMETERSRTSPVLDQPAAAESKIQDEVIYLLGNSSDLDDSDSDITSEEAEGSPVSGQTGSALKDLLPESEQALLEVGKDIEWLENEANRYAERAELQPIQEEASESLYFPQTNPDSVISGLRAALGEERRRRMDTAMRSDRICRQLRHVEGRYREEVKRGEMTESARRCLELELAELLVDRKQLTEDLDTAQSLLTQERSDRVREKMELEEESRRNLSQIKEAKLQLAEASEKERELMQKNRTLQDEVTALTMELEQENFRRQEEDDKSSEAKEAQAEKLQNLKKDLELSEDVLAKTVSQFNGQLNTLRARLEASAKIAVRLSELEKEREELISQAQAERNKAMIMSQLKEALDIKLEAEIKRNTELLRESSKLKTLTKTIKEKLTDQHSREMNNKQVEAEGVICKLEAQVKELALQLEKEALKYCRLEVQNRELEDQLSFLQTMAKRFERAKRKRKTLEEDATGLRQQVEACRLELLQANKDRKEAEERAHREFRKRLEEVNLFYRTQAASQESLERVRTANDVSLRGHLEQRNRELETELERAKAAQQDSLTQRDATKAETQYYRGLYNEELRLRKTLAAKLDRTNERLDEANSRHQRNIHMLTSSIINGNDTNT